ncbi:MAG: S8 family serine peptidase, partial [Planctomycetes bacterium]|nr:S8 family serine peptidase [Planctomycetota bacterium]
TMAADRATFNIVSANMSYSASSDPLDVSQQAIDSAALNADVTCCVAAGNSGSSTIYSCGAANALAVAALNANTHTVASFSSRGPLNGDPGRFYPDIAACGVSTVMARRDNETSNYTDSGTSMASPQVAGAAAQLRARFPSMTGLEAKAVLLASCLDISTQNAGLNRNAFGMGMLRNDRAHDLALAGDLGSGSVVTSSPTLLPGFPVVVGHSYSAAIAWHRLDLNSTAWSNLDLEVLDQNGTVIGQSSTSRNLYEVASFTANFTGTVLLRVTALSVGGGSSQPFAWAGTEIPPIPVTGTAVGYGVGCSPLCATINSSGGTLVPVTLSVEFAYDMVAASATVLNAVDVFTSSRLATSTAAVVTIYRSVGGAISQSSTAVAACTVGTTPGWYRATFASPVQIPAGPFWIGIDYRNNNTNYSNLSTGTVVGGYQRPTLLSGPWTRSALTVRPGFRLLCESPVGVGVPRLSVVGTPRTGQTTNLDLSGALPSSAAFLAIGFSSTNWSGGALPYPLEPLGAPGCSVLTSADSRQLLVIDALGAAHGSLSIPNNPVFVHLQLYAQYIVLHPTANSLGMVVTAGSHLSVGN